MIQITLRELALALPDLGGGGGEGEPTSPKVFPRKLLIEKFPF